MYSGDQCLIPNIRAQFPHFGLKIVEHSAQLPEATNNAKRKMDKAHRLAFSDSPVSLHGRNIDFSYCDSHV